MAQYINIFMDDAERFYTKYVESGYQAYALSAYNMVQKAKGLCEYGSFIQENMDWNMDELDNISFYLLALVF